MNPITRRKAIISYSVVFAILLGWLGARYLFFDSRTPSLTTELTTFLVEEANGSQGEVTVTTTGKVIRETVADQNLDLGLAEIEELIERGPYTDPEGRFRIVPNAPRHRLELHVAAPQSTNEALARAWLADNRYPHIPDFKIDVLPY